MKSIIVSLAFVFCIFSSYAEPCSYNKKHISKEEKSNDLNRNLSTLLCRSLNFHSISTSNSLIGTPNGLTVSSKIKSKSYNPFLDTLYSRTIWVPLLKVSHDFSHLIIKNNRWFIDVLLPWDQDLKSDYLLGYIQGKLGASQNDIQVAFVSLFEEASLEKHSAMKRRLDALIAGHSRALYRY